MSKPRYTWWSYIRHIVERYPARVRAGPVDAEGLDGLEKREVEAVRAAIEETDPEELDLIAAYYWTGGAPDLETAAASCFISTQTAQRRHGKFIRRVAWHLFNINEPKGDTDT